MVDLDEMMNKINNIDARVEELYSKTFEYCEKDVLVTEEVVNSDCYLKSCIAQQAKEIRALARQVDNQKDTTNEIAKERDNLAASLEAEKEHAKACNNNFYDYRLSTTATIKGYQQELEKARSERDTAKADVKVLNKNHRALGEQYNDLMRKYDEVRSERDTVQSRCENQKKEINLLLKQKDKLEKELEACESHKVDMMAYRDDIIGRITSERDTAKALNEQLHADFDVLAKNHKALGEQYDDLRRQLCDELKGKDEDIKSLKETVSNLKTDIKYSKTRYVDKTIAFNRLNGEHLDLKKERDALTKELAKYSWKRVDRSEPLPLEDHQLYLFAIDGYPTPVKGKFHDDSLSNISIIVDDGDGKGPVYKVLFFMDGCIRYWMPLPEMPDMPEGGNDDD